MRDVDVIVDTVRSYDRGEIVAFVERVFTQFEDRLAPAMARGDKALVVVKPNWLCENHLARPESWISVITHPLVVVAVVECLAARMNGCGTICVCDAPTTQADFERVIARGQLMVLLDELRQRYPRLRLEVIDLRREVWVMREGVVVERRVNKPDPRGYVAVNLGRDSMFFGHRGEGRYYGADYDRQVIHAHHQGDLHEYLLSGSAMACDLFVNLPKIKTHKKTGLTCCLKNLVGINGDKNWLPHHTEGSWDSGGDEFPPSRRWARIEGWGRRVGQEIALKIPWVGSFVYRKMRKLGTRTLGDSERIIRAGNWYGNDTCWRMVLDLNRALLYGNQDGSCRNDAPRPYLAVADGIVAGEGNGPACPDEIGSHFLLGCAEPAAGDLVACRLMGFDPAKVPVVHHAFAPHRWPLGSRRARDITVLDLREGRVATIESLSPGVPFRPHFGWGGLSLVASRALR